MRSLRPRSNVDYSSDGASEAALSVESASKWDRDTVQHLSIEVIDVDAMFPGYADLPNEAAPLVISEWTDCEWLRKADTTKYSKKIKTLMRKVRKISEGSRITHPEVLIDGFMSSLLYLLGFDEDPCELYPQYHYYMNVGSPSRRITAKPDFAIITEKNNLFLVIEDKAIDNATHSNNWKEDQVLGEIFVAVHYIVARSTKGITFPVHVYAVRVVGTMFTFYKAAATSEYVVETAEIGASKHHKMEVLRCPPIKKPVFTAYDICNKHDRVCILHTLCSIKQLMQQ